MSQILKIKKKLTQHSEISLNLSELKVYVEDDFQLLPAKFQLNISEINLTCSQFCVGEDHHLESGWHPASSYFL